MTLATQIETALPGARIEYVRVKPLPVVTWHFVCRWCDNEFDNDDTVPGPIYCDCGEVCTADVCIRCCGPGCQFDDTCGLCAADDIRSGHADYERMCALFGKFHVDRAMQMVRS